MKTVTSLLLLTFRNAHSFVVSSYPTTRALWSQFASRSICTFDETDFQGTIGDWPYTAKDMKRLDETDDDYFYDTPRFVTHIDDGAIAALKEFYNIEITALQPTNGKVDILDLCSSWISHLPDNVPFGRVVGIGMNEEELKANPQLTEYHVQDLNKEPLLSRFQDNSFDVICNVVSVDYLTSPKEMFQDIHRVLRPGGIAIMSFSNRCFPTKAVGMWLLADTIGRMTIVASYFHYTAKWTSIEALDLIDARLETPPRPSLQEMFNNPAAGFAWMSTATSVAKSNSGDPMYAVKGTK